MHTTPARCAGQPVQAAEASMATATDHIGLAVVTAPW